MTEQEQFICGWNSAVDRYYKPTDFINDESNDFQRGVSAVWEYIKHHDVPLYQMKEMGLYL